MCGVGQVQPLVGGRGGSEGGGELGKGEAGTGCGQEAGEEGGEAWNVPPPLGGGDMLWGKGLGLMWSL